MLKMISGSNRCSTRLSLSLSLSLSLWRLSYFIVEQITLYHVNKWHPIIKCTIKCKQRQVMFPCCLVLWSWNRVSPRACSNKRSDQKRSWITPLLNIKAVQLPGYVEFCDSLHHIICLWFWFLWDFIYLFIFKIYWMASCQGFVIECFSKMFPLLILILRSASKQVYLAAQVYSFMYILYLLTLRPSSMWWVWFFIGKDFDKWSITSLTLQWTLCSEWVPSEWELITTLK